MKKSFKQFLVFCALFQGKQLCCLNVGVKAEWDKPEIILVHSPGKEVFHGLLHANAALFESPFDRYGAKKEHQKYIKELQKNNSIVIQIVDVLLQGTLNGDDSKRDGEDLDNLIEFASQSLTYNFSPDFSSAEIVEQEKYKKENMRKIHPRDLVRIILEKPVINLSKSTEKNTQFIAEPYLTYPLMNMHFLRDQQITTDKGVVIGKMNSIQRNHEVDVMVFVFRKLGIEPIYRVTGSGRLEGGDFIPVGDFALLGQGLRTNEEGVRQLLENKVFDFPEVAVVKDPFQHQDQMHLDTYFNIVGIKKAVVDKIRRDPGVINQDGIQKNIRPLVDVYQKTSDGSYECIQKDKDFFEYLEDEKGFEIITIEHEEQLNYGCNFLCIGDNKIIGVKDVSVAYEQRLKRAGIDVKLLDFRNVTKSYGGPHCTTQVIYRIP